jgi:hypothetical protein
MQKNTWLALATTIGSAICWWPCFILQNSQRNWHAGLLALAFFALLTGSAVVISGGCWVRFWMLSFIATFFGVLSGAAIWPDQDARHPSVPSQLLFAALFAAMAMLVSLVAGLAARFSLRFRENNEPKSAARS